MVQTTNPLYLGSHPAVDFLNTAFAPDGVKMEAIPDGRALLDWMVGAGLLDEAAAKDVMQRFGRKAIDATAARAKRMRERARLWLTRWRDAPERGYSEEIAALNHALARGAWRRQIVVTDQGARIIERPQLDTADALLALIAWHMATLVTEEEASLVKQCTGAGCTLWFLDRTKAHRRRFCSAAVCGNRAKVAAFRKRQRQ
jgi:predicted RNA-binding Zn ribbon-like protein